MKKNAFPLIASCIGLLLALVLARSVGGDGDSEPLLPRLTLLFISEFGFVVTAAGAWVGGRSWLSQRSQLSLLLISAGCLGLALAFLYIGIALWSGLAS